MFSPCVFPLRSGNRSRFVGSGHQTKETGIEANFSWQTALSIRPNVMVYKRPRFGSKERIPDTPAPPFNTTSAQTTITLPEVTVAVDVGIPLSRAHLVRWEGCGLGFEPQLCKGLN